MYVSWIMRVIVGMLQCGDIIVSCCALCALLFSCVSCHSTRYIFLTSWHFPWFYCSVVYTDCVCMLQSGSCACHRGCICKNVHIANKCDMIRHRPCMCTSSHLMKLRCHVFNSVYSSVKSMWDIVLFIVLDNPCYSRHALIVFSDISFVGVLCTLLARC